MEKGQRLISVRYFNIMNFISVIIFRRINVFRVVIVFWGFIAKLIELKF